MPGPSLSIFTVWSTYSVNIVQALPIFIDKLTDPITAIVLSVTVVLAFGEIIPVSILAGIRVVAVCVRGTSCMPILQRHCQSPEAGWHAERHPANRKADAGCSLPLQQAVCSRYGLAVGSYSSWFVRALMIVCWPIGAPSCYTADASKPAPLAARSLSHTSLHSCGQPANRVTSMQTQQ